MDYKNNKFWQLIPEKKRVCSKCGNPVTLHTSDIHHKDGKRYNNEVDNLELLCTKCHRGLEKENWAEIMITVSYRFPAKLLKKIDEVAEKERVSDSSIVRKILMEELKVE